MYFSCWAFYPFYDSQSVSSHSMSFISLFLHLLPFGGFLIFVLCFIKFTRRHLQSLKIHFTYKLISAKINLTSGLLCSWENDLLVCVCVEVYFFSIRRHNASGYSLLLPDVMRAWILITWHSGTGRYMLHTIRMVLRSDWCVLLTGQKALMVNSLETDRPLHCIGFEWGSSKQPLWLFCVVCFWVVSNEN